MPGVTRIMRAGSVDREVCERVQHGGVEPGCADPLAISVVPSRGMGFDDRVSEESTAGVDARDRVVVARESDGNAGPPAGASPPPSPRSVLTG